MILDKFFSPIILLATNVIIILLAEFVGNGTYFYTAGIIHVIALLFVALAITRIHFHYYTYDPVLENFLHAGIGALLVFGASHIVEFVSIMVLKMYHDSTFAGVTQFYIASILLIALGAEIFLRTHAGRSGARLWSIVAIIAFLFVLTAYFLATNIQISFEADSVFLYIYTAAVLTSGVFGFIQMMRIKKLVPMMDGFIDYMMFSIVVVVLATLPNIFYDIIKSNTLIHEYQIVYVSHFAFYAALSILFLAFRRLSNLTGVYKDLELANQKISDSFEKF